MAEPVVDVREIEIRGTRRDLGWLKSNKEALVAAIKADTGNNVFGRITGYDRSQGAKNSLWSILGRANPISKLPEAAEFAKNLADGRPGFRNYDAENVNDMLAGSDKVWTARTRTLAAALAATNKQINKIENDDKKADSDRREAELNKQYDEEYASGTREATGEDPAPYYQRLIRLVQDETAGKLSEEQIKQGEAWIDSLNNKGPKFLAALKAYKEQYAADRQRSLRI